MARNSILVLVSLMIGFVSSYPQSNYADQANNVEYIGGLPEQATLDGKVTRLDDLSPIITLNRTRATLNCSAGSMEVELKFNDKFFGIAYANFDRNSACQITGKGALAYKLELPLKGCGTKQNPQRVFTNNIVVRFHPGLEIDGDEIITIVCRYPPPITPVVPPAPPILNPYQAATTPSEPPLNGFHILLIICGILFLSLLLLGLGCSYYCLKRRTIPVIQKAPYSTIETDSEITRLSESSLGGSLIEKVAIPRVHAPQSSSSETLPSDYPSESHSEAEDVDARSLPVSSAGSFENRAYVHETSSFYSDHYGHTQEERIKNAIATPAMQQRLPMPIKEEPKFDVQVRVKKVPPPSPASLSDSDTQSARNLSTIMEQREESVRSSPLVDKTQFTYVPELHPPPKHVQAAPTFTKILKRQQEIAEDLETIKSPTSRGVINIDTDKIDTFTTRDIYDETEHKFIAPAPPPPPPIIPKQRVIKDEGPPQEYPVIPATKPEITSHMVDDVYLRTITEKKRIEDIERHKRYVTEYHTRPKPLVDQRWDVKIKNYPIEMPEPPEWENFSDISSASNLTLTPKMERAPLSLPPQPQIDDDKLPLTAPEIVSHIASSPQRRYVSTREETTRESYLETFKIPPENPEVRNWNVLLRVLQPQDDEGPVLETAEQFNSQLTMADKMKWRQIITTESTLRTLLTEATVREDFERIRTDQRYEPLFEPPKWDVIIRILAPPDKKNKGHYKKKSDWDNRSRRSSLPTLYEYDSDGGSSIKTLTHEPALRPHLPQRHRKSSSRSSYRSEADVRSMSEVTVDFARPDHGDAQSEVSSYYPTGPGRYEDEDSEPETDYKPGSGHLTRSLSQPSLARSASEFTERWVAPSRYDTASEYTTPEGTPRSQRSTRIQPVHVPRSGTEQSSLWEQSSSSQIAQAPGGARIVAQQFRSEMSSSYQQSGRLGRNWFGDNDSEASFK